MRWNRDTRYRDDGYWRCDVKWNEKRRGRYDADFLYRQGQIVMGRHRRHDRKTKPRRDLSRMASFLVTVRTGRQR